VWEEFAGKLFAPPYAVGGAASSKHNAASVSAASVPVRLLGVPDARLFLRRAMALLRQPALVNLASRVVAASSVDRKEEAPALALVPSRCQVSLASSMEDTEAVPRFLHYAAWMQGHCGCGGEGEPCYWSSAPSRHASTVEYLSVQLADCLALVAGFSVTPYQAFFHPAAPIYAPVEVAIQFLRAPTQPASSHTATTATTTAATTATTTTEAAAEAARVRFAADFPLIPLTPEQLEIERVDRGASKGVGVEAEAGAGAGSVYYQSPFYAVQKKFKSQKFMLPSPVLCFPSGGAPLVRLLFRGKQQRQTVGPDDFYMCICNLQVLALPPLGFDLVPGRARSGLPFQSAFDASDTADIADTADAADADAADLPPAAPANSSSSASSVLPPPITDTSATANNIKVECERFDGFHLQRGSVQMQHAMREHLPQPTLFPDFVSRHLTGAKTGKGTEADETGVETVGAQTSVAGGGCWAGTKL
jgi:hypothetical protein